MTRRRPLPEGPCHYCGGPATTRDHIVPRHWGGPNCQDNLVAACGDCNVAKGNGRPTCGCDRCVTAVALWWPDQPGRLTQRVVVPGFEWLATV